MKRKTYSKSIAAVTACALATAGIPFSAVQAAEPGVVPQPKFYFDMETLENGQIVNQADGTAYDVGGNAGELVDSIGDNGSALKFDGSNYVDLGTSFQPENAYTMTGWIRQDDGAADGQAVFSRAWSGKTQDQLAMMIRNGQVYHAFSVGSSNNEFKEFYTDSVLKTEKWEHVALTRDGSEIKVYVNGENIYSGTDFSSDNFAEAAKHMYIGMDCDGNGQLYGQHAFKGALDELRLYDTALTEEQIRELAYVESSYEIESVSNGEIIVALKGEEEPGQDDFTLNFEVDGKETEVKVTGYQYEAESKKAIFSFEPIQNVQNVEKEVKVTVGYQNMEQEASFILPAGENESPEVSNLNVVNLSEKLGKDPHVKGMLKAEYTFEDSDNDAEGDTKYQWYIADTADGEYTKLSGICTQTVILLDDYVGKYLKCEITPADVNGNKGEPVMTPASSAPVQATEGNPLTDWLHNAGFGLSHHFLSNYFNLPAVYTSPEEMWDRDKMTWDEFVGQFDAEAYAKQVNDIGAKYVIITLGQNSGSYCAPNDVYDKYMREAGFIKEGEKNPKTTSYENDLPMKMADALAKYGIKVMLYLPSNPPHSACWDETGDPNGYGYYTDYLVTKDVFHYTPGQDGNPSQESRKILAEMVEWWSLHYGDKIAGWWFDGFYHEGNGSQMDMSLEYNVSTLANAAKAGNPYSIVTFNKGMSNGARYQKVTEYTDYTAGECTGLDGYPIDGRWAEGSTDCQNFMFGPLGSRDSWQNGWGCSGINHKDVSEVVNFVDGALEREHAIALDVRVNVHGQIDPDQYKQLQEVAKLWADKSELQTVLKEAESIDLSEYEEEGQEDFLKAKEDAASVNAQADATQEEVDAAAGALRTAIDNLVKKESVSKKTLDYFLNKAKDHVENGDVDGCVESVKKLFEEAIAGGEAVMADDSATRQEVMDATMKLIKAIHALDMEAGDKTDLEMAIDLGNTVRADLDKYVEDGKQEFIDALANAQEVFDDGDAFPEDVNQAYNTLLETMAELRLKADKSSLEDLLNSVKDLDLTKYTDESAEAFKVALANAQAVMADETLSEDDQEKVDQAAAALSEAYEKLELKEGDTSGDSDKDQGNNSSTDGGNKDGGKTGTSPKTGDTVPVIPGGMMLVSAAAVLAVLKKRGLR